ncbi:dihydropteroate synthase [Aeromicrobium duanguangcaii]|uniref:dihydropteroate synthase n=2 Tax=Aeromicrobium duanguangcaii TaxID=2968086 RepID=A0ABY5KM05_9ACTN|nr:dihydropteroate synthase [Aeromicrobium duanguangcaii]MCD9155147.1 dihydropteroate synthase [Aeromicrobium duanguangcaii]UUI70075.1 dihydropteroate synthase [Aeromicrobium duanguangcaii]
MGVVNVTPDSFSDGGRWFDPGAAAEHGFELVRHGADLVDVGGESTRPGALPVDREEELRRVVPVVRRLADAGVLVSVDTMWAETAEQAIDAGAVLVNDVSGGRADPAMVPLVARTGVPFVVMHWRAHSEQMQQHTEYRDVVEDVLAELWEQFDAVCDAGVDPDRIVLDPGLGFSKTGDQNWTLLAHLDRFTSLGRPLLVAASRKGFLGALLADEVGPRPVEEREDATAAISTLSALAGAWGVRVHEPRRSADAVRVVARLRAERPGE